MRALIAGGGIGGLTTALALHRIGIEVEVLERAAIVKEVGAGIQLSPNAMKVLGALDLETDLLKTAFEPQQLEMRLGRSGRKIFSIPAAESARRRWHAPYLNIHRSDLLGVLLKAVNGAKGITLRLGAKVVGYDTHVAGVSVRLADKTVLAGDFLVGADGLHSMVRTQMVGTDKPTYTGNMAWRATVPLDQLGATAPPPTACIWVGKKRHAVTYRLRGGALANFVGVVEGPQDGMETWTETGKRSLALRDFDGWNPVITALIQNASRLYRWPLFDRTPLGRWHDERVVLIGDAAHPTLPFLAQGAAMAIEDAFILSRLVGESGTLPAISGLHGERIQRTSRIRLASRTNMGLFHRSHWFSQLATYGPIWLAGRLMPSVLQSRQDWIYRYDATGMRGSPV